MTTTGDLGRRLRWRREELGLSCAAVEAATGIGSGYLEYLERTPNANVGVETLIRLAVFLQTTPEQLRGADADRPPGRQGPAPGPSIRSLGPVECMELLGSKDIGRFVFHSERGPVALPVNYVVADGDIVFRTAEDNSISAAAPDAPVSFEVDRIDDAQSEGWSVLLTGRVQRIEDPEAQARFAADGPDPWAGGHRPVLLRFLPIERSGRRITAR